jgi:hypothetical protein
MAPSPRLHRSAALLLGTITLAAAVPVGAQVGAGRGFLFREPNGSVTFRGGLAAASARSDIFAEVVQSFTLSRSDFRSPTFGAEFALSLAPRVDAVLGAAHMGRSARSEYRDWVDNNDRPIEQTTVLRRTPLTAGFKTYLTPRGRTVGRFAWVPSRIAPYLGGGGGVMFHRFTQKGDFVDFRDSSVFETEGITSSGKSLMAYAAAGLDYSLTPYFALTGEGRYGWAKAAMDDRNEAGEPLFEGYERIDLSGYTATIGLTIRF